jgi:hypothetical protein
MKGLFHRFGQAESLLTPTFSIARPTGPTFGGPDDRLRRA